MKIAPLLSVLLLCGGNALAVSLEEAIQEGLEAKLESGRLTEADIPREWRSSVMVSTNGRYVTRAWSRGTNKVMEVTWRREWNGARVGMFSALLLDGTNELGKALEEQDAAKVKSPPDDRPPDNG